MVKRVKVVNEHPEDRKMRQVGEKYGAQHAAEFFATLANPHGLIGLYNDQDAHNMLEELRQRFWCHEWEPKAK